MIVLLALLLLGCGDGGHESPVSPPVPARHTMAVWDRNPDADQVSYYLVYLCAPRPCEVVKYDQVEQPPVGQRPQWHLPVDLNGLLAVSAVNAAGESPLSQIVEFTS